MIILKNLEIEECLTKPSVSIRIDHQCAYCGGVIWNTEIACKVSFRYDGKLYPLYFHKSENVDCFYTFCKINNES
jgi:hypothetical protein